VASALIAAALGAVGGDTALDQARGVARRRLPALRRTAPARAAARLRDHLLRRGYAAPIVARVVREAIGVATEA
jgi:SOS response regulatory protein OraA/RecX